MQPLLGWVRPGHWRALDRLVAAGYAVLSLPLLLNHGNVLALVVALGTGGPPMALRRDRPVLALLLALAGSLVVGLVEPRVAVLGLGALAYVLYVVAMGRVGLAAGALVLALGAALATALPDFRHLGGAQVFSVLYAGVWLVGFAVGLHRRYTNDLLRTQDALARQGVVEERLRIARELHDVIAHGMSVITVQAGFGSLVIDQRPEQAKEALGAIETTGRAALAEMRLLLGVLRAPGSAPDLAPAAGLGELDALVASTGRAGVVVAARVTGTTRALPPVVDLSAYRIVQESLTNVVKHAAATRAEVLVHYAEHELVIEVTDNGTGQPVRAAGVGHGLVGMRERASLCGGSISADAVPGQGFRVLARLPLPAGVPA